MCLFSLKAVFKSEGVLFLRAWPAQFKPEHSDNVGSHNTNFMQNHP